MLRQERIQGPQMIPLSDGGSLTGFHSIAHFLSDYSFFHPVYFLLQDKGSAVTIIHYLNNSGL